VRVVASDASARPAYRVTTRVAVHDISTSSTDTRARSAAAVAAGAGVVVLKLAAGLLALALARPWGTYRDEYALRWHVFVWDLWFLVWGLALAVAAVRYRRRTVL
jgi:hypothetical protein